jgi:cell division protein FtsB
MSDVMVYVGLGIFVVVLLLNFGLSRYYAQKLMLKQGQLSRKELALEEWGLELVKREDELNAMVELANSPRLPPRWAVRQ